ncbi:MAG: sulfur carrier protein ThiS [Luteolibacter sp.]
MTIQLNGQAHPLENETTLTALLESLGLGGKPVVVEHNREAIRPADFSTTPVKSGDQLEIVTLAAGG